MGDVSKRLTGEDDGVGAKSLSEMITGSSSNMVDEYAVDSRMIDIVILEMLLLFYFMADNNIIVVVIVGERKRPRLEFL